MDSDDLASMYAQIVRGVAKEDSRFVTDDESSALWETIAREVVTAKAENPEVVFDIPSELPYDGPAEDGSRSAAPDDTVPAKADADGRVLPETESKPTAKSKPTAPAESGTAPESEVIKALRALRAGDRTIEDVEAMFAARTWPATTRRAANAEEAFKREQEDRDPDPPGSFSEVAQAYYTGVIDTDTYERLASAAASAKSGAKPRPEPPPGHVTPPRQ